jgi:Type IX secretion system protein PorV
LTPPKTTVMRKLYPLISGVICLFLTKASQSQSSADSINAIANSNTAAPFLRMNADVRASGIGGTGIALPGDNITSYVNPARMIQVSTKCAANVSYAPSMTNLVKNIALYSFSGHYKTSDNEVISAGIRYFKQGELKQTSDQGDDLGSTHPYDMAIDASYARRLSDKLFIGASFRYIYSHIVNSGFQGYKNATAVAADLGLYYQTKENSNGQSWNLGAVVSNVGSKLKYGSSYDGYSLPATAGLGVAFKQKLTDEDELIFSGDVLAPITTPISGKGFFENRMQYNAGGEYGYHSMFFIRAGYSSENTQYSRYNLVTTGMGFYYKSCRLDLAYLIPTGGSTSSTISNIFKIGFSFILK